MHGGVAGGVRVPDAASVVQWWMALGTDELDVQYPGMDVPDIGPLREDFLKHLPQEQPMLSLTLAGVKHEQAVRTNESIKISILGNAHSTEARTTSQIVVLIGL